jgi:hypothetical protein
LHAFLADGTGGNDRPCPHAHAIEEDGAHTDQRVVLDDGAMNDGAVPNPDRSPMIDGKP